MYNIPYPDINFINFGIHNYRIFFNRRGPTNIQLKFMLCSFRQAIMLQAPNFRMTIVMFCLCSFIHFHSHSPYFNNLSFNYLIRAKLTYIILYLSVCLTSRQLRNAFYFLISKRDVSEWKNWINLFTCIKSLVFLSRLSN